MITIDYVYVLTGFYLHRLKYMPFNFDFIVYAIDTYSPNYNF